MGWTNRNSTHSARESNDVVCRVGGWQDESTVEGWTGVYSKRRVAQCPRSVSPVTSTSSDGSGLRFTVITPTALCHNHPIIPCVSIHRVPRLTPLCSGSGDSVSEKGCDSASPFHSSPSPSSTLSPTLRATYHPTPHLPSSLHPSRPPSRSSP
jgi:hypothetical protein